MLVIGLTGGIASGKSTVAKRLIEFGALHIDADKISREIIAKATPAYNEIISYFGKEVQLETGEINRKALADIIFKNPTARDFLMQVTHPRILEKSQQLINNLKKQDKNTLIILDAALLIESKAIKMVDKVWLVYCSLDTQIKRLIKRDGISYDQAVKRIKSQMPLAEKLTFADEVINNEGNIEYTMLQIEKLWKRYTEWSNV